MGAYPSYVSLKCDAFMISDGCRRMLGGIGRLTKGRIQYL